MHYNPFAYIHNEKDILKLVTVLIANTKGEGKSGDDFWVKAETLLYTALIGYIYYEAPSNEQNFSTLVEMINAMEVREDDETFKNAVDLLFDALEQKDPDHFALRQYKKYKLAAGKTAKSILISCGARLAPFDIKEVREITMYDELELDLVGDRKTALFFIISDCISGVAGAVLYCRSVGRACMAGDRVSDKPLRSANGGGLAGRDDRRRKPRTQRFCIWINLWAGHFRCPALFFTIRGCLTRQLFLFGGIT